MNTENPDLSDGEIYTPERGTQSPEIEEEPIDPEFEISQASNAPEAGAESAENAPAESKGGNSVLNKSVLSKHQAKSRLKAFSLVKQNLLPVSPLKKKVMKSTGVVQAKEEYDENGKKILNKNVIKKPPRKGSNPDEKAKAVIEEIESLKRAQNAYFQEMVAKIENRSRSRSRSREKSKRRRSYSRSYDYERSKSPDPYPRNWSEMIDKNMDFNKIKRLNSKSRSRKRRVDCYDFRKQLSFRASYPLNPLKIKTILGGETTVPPQYIRYTVRTPAISYSVNHVKNPEIYPTRREVFREIPRSIQSGLYRIIENKKTFKYDHTNKVTTRKWYPKIPLAPLDSTNECEILEPSLGLSFLQNYSDAEEEEEKDDAETENKLPEDINATPEEKRDHQPEQPEENNAEPEVPEEEANDVPDKNETGKVAEKESTVENNWEEDSDEEESSEEEEKKKKKKRKKTKKEDKKERKKKLKRALMLRKKALKKKKLKKKLKKQKEEKLKKKRLKKKIKEEDSDDSDKNINKKKTKKKTKQKSDSSDSSESDFKEKRKKRTVKNGSESTLDESLPDDKASEMVVKPPKEIIDFKNHKPEKLVKCDKKDTKKKAEDKETVDVQRSRNRTISESEKDSQDSKRSSTRDKSSDSLGGKDLKSVEKVSYDNEKDKRGRGKSLSRDRESSRDSQKQRDSKNDPIFPVDKSCQKPSRSDSSKEKLINQDGDDSHSSKNKKDKEESANRGADDKGSHSPKRVKETSRKSENLKVQSSKDEDSEDNVGTPNTDDYHSHWESEDDVSMSLVSEDKSFENKGDALNQSWESDEDLQRDHHDKSVTVPLSTDTLLNDDRTSNRQKLFSERSLEMPLNIRGFTSRTFLQTLPENRKATAWPDVSRNFSEDSWERGDYLSSTDPNLEIRKLVQERESLNEERRKLEIEKRKLAELEKRRMEEIERNYQSKVYVPSEEAEKVFKYREGGARSRSKEDSDRGIKVNAGEMKADDKKKPLEKATLGKSRPVNEEGPDNAPVKLDFLNVQIKQEKLSDDDLDPSKCPRNVPEVQQSEPSLCVLETEYEEFMKAVAGDVGDKSKNVCNVKIKKEKDPEEKHTKRTRRRSDSSSSSSSSSSDSSDSYASSDSSSSSSSSSSGSDKEKKKGKKTPDLSLSKSSEAPVFKEHVQFPMGFIKKPIIPNIDVNIPGDVEKPVDAQPKQNDVNIFEQEHVLTKPFKPVGEIPLPVPSPLEASSPLKPNNVDAKPAVPQSPISGNADSTTSPVKKINVVPMKFLVEDLRTESPKVSIAVPFESTETMLSDISNFESGTDSILNESSLDSRKRKFSFSSLSLPAKRPLLENSVFSSDDEGIPKKFPTNKSQALSLAAEEVPCESLDGKLPPAVAHEVPGALQEREPAHDRTNVTEQLRESPSTYRKRERSHDKDYHKSKDVRPSRERYDGDRKDSSRKREQSPKRRRWDPSPRRSRIPSPRRDVSPKRHRDSSPNRRGHSPRRSDPHRRRGPSPRRREVSPRRRILSPHRSAPSHRRYDRENSPKSRNQSPSRYRDGSPRRFEASPRPKDRILSPRRGSPRHFDRNMSPRSVERDVASPRRFDRIISPNRELLSRHSGRHSPRHDDGHMADRMNHILSPKDPRMAQIRSPTPESKNQPIQVTLQRLVGMEDFRSNKSPIHSPLDGLKRSLADSTISDDQLLEHNIDEYVESPNYNRQHLLHPAKRIPESPSSPRRISLDDRINQVLGIEKESPKAITTTYAQNYYNQQYYNNYTHYPDHTQYIQPTPTPVRSTTSYPEVGKSKVLQVGNVLEVVPTEDIPVPRAEIMEPPAAVPQQIVQVGNMLQIVPTATQENPLPPAPPVQAPAAKEKLSAEAIMKQKNAERIAEREKRRQERERRRKEKEKKKKEKEKRKQMKLKFNTDMIKRALLLETEGAASLGEEENQENEDEIPIHWPPVPIIVSNMVKPVGKGILISHGFSNINRDDGDGDRKKSVKFADGVRPGEGTSPSGGEELSSPPPQPVKLPKEKRYTKTKKPKKVKAVKKKVKVKVIRNIVEDDDEEDNLPPPSPPPGSPPPHIFPPRVKTHTINNIHPNFSPGIPVMSSSAVQNYRPPLPPVSIPPPNHHVPAHSQPPPGLQQPVVHQQSTIHQQVGVLQQHNNNPIHQQPPLVHSHTLHQPPPVHQPPPAHGTQLHHGNAATHQFSGPPPIHHPPLARHHGPQGIIHGHHHAAGTHHFGHHR